MHHFALTTRASTVTVSHIHLLTVLLHTSADGACVRGQDLPPVRPTVHPPPVKCLTPEPPADPRIRKQGLPADLNL